MLIVTLQSLIFLRISISRSIIVDFVKIWAGNSYFFMIFKIMLYIILFLLIHTIAFANRINSFRLTNGDEIKLLSSKMIESDWQYDFEKLKTLVNDRIGLIVVDTISMLYRTELSNKDVFELNRELGSQISFLAEIARKHNLKLHIN